MKKLLAIIISLFLLTDIYGQVSYDIQFTHDGKTVFGTFSAPSDAGHFPTVIIAPGSGPNDRNGTLTLADSTAECLYPELVNETLLPYQQLAEALVDSGFAVLRYDKLEYTYTPAQLGSITFHKLWLPVESAISYVKTRSDVDTNCISLVGHSEGASLIPYIALGRSDINALVSIAGARTPFDSILAYQLVNIARTCDDDTISAHFVADQILEYYHLVRINHGIGLPPLFGVPATVWYEYLLATEAVSDNYNLANLPTLFIGLELDINVPPAELVRFQNEVTVTDDFWSLPGIIHYMTPYNDPMVSEMLTDTIIYWLRQQCLSTSVYEEQSHLTYTLYPNPFTDYIFVTFPEAKSEALYTITDMAGMILTQKNADGEPDEYTDVLDLQFLPPGAYRIGVTINERHADQIVIKK